MNISPTIIMEYQWNNGNYITFNYHGKTHIYIVNGDSNGNRTKYNGIEWNMDINDMRYLMILVELYLYVTSYAGHGMFNGNMGINGDNMGLILSKYQGSL